MMTLKATKCYRIPDYHYRTCRSSPAYFPCIETSNQPDHIKGKEQTIKFYPEPAGCCLGSFKSAGQQVCHYVSRALGVSQRQPARNWKPGHSSRNICPPLLFGVCDYIAPHCEKLALLQTAQYIHLHPYSVLQYCMFNEGTTLFKVNKYNKWELQHSTMGILTCSVTFHHLTTYYNFFMF